MQTSSSLEEVAAITIYDMTGRIIKNMETNLIKGLNTIDLDVNNLESVIYLFSIKTANGTRVEKFVKQ